MSHGISWHRGHLLWCPSVSLSFTCLSWDSQSEPSCDTAGAWGGTGRGGAARRGRIQTYATMNAPTAKRPQIIIVLALQRELALCNQIQVLSCDLPVAAGDKDRTLTRRIPIKSADQGLATGTKQTSSPASLGDSATLIGSVECPCAPGTSLTPSLGKARVPALS